VFCIDCKIKRKGTQGGLVSSTESPTIGDISETINEATDRRKSSRENKLLKYEQAAEQDSKFQQAVLNNMENLNKELDQNREYKFAMLALMS